MYDKNLMFSAFVDKAKKLYGPDFIPLHRPVFEGNEVEYLRECVESNFVSSMGSFVNRFEADVANFSGSAYAIATVNGTSALHIAMLVAGVQPGDEVISQALTFVATCNAMSYIGAFPLFIDVDRDTMGMSPSALRHFLENNTFREGGSLFNRASKRRIKACVPMHTYGIPCRIKEIQAICKEWGIALIEDAAESLGSYSGGQHTGSIGMLGVYSFNGNKVITTGGGGMIVTDDKELASKARHLTTTAKIPHPTEFVHDEIGYNYRLPGLCAALGVAQMERLDEFLVVKEKIAQEWRTLFSEFDLELNEALPGDKSNNWFNSVTLDSQADRDEFLQYSNDRGVMTRPLWELMSNLQMFRACYNDGLLNSKWLLSRVVAVSSSVPDGALKTFNKGIDA
jgi:aminotransferase in exopolysaccharide biosynthesis